MFSIFKLGQAIRSALRAACELAIKVLKRCELRRFPSFPNRRLFVKFTDVPDRRAFLSPSVKTGMIKVIKMDLHGYHPSEIVQTDVLKKIIQQTWEMGENYVTLIHGHGRNRGISPGFVNTNTGYFGLEIRRALRRDTELRQWIRYPLDGGRVFRAIVWAITGNMGRSTLIAANVGRFFAFLLIFAGVWQIFSGNLGGGLWVAFIGWFLDNAASVQIQQVMFRGLLTGHLVSQAMSTNCAVIPEDLTLQQLVDERILGSGQRSFLVNRGDETVNRGDETVGLITLHQIKEVPRPKWPTTSAAQVMLPLEKLKCTDPDIELWSALQEMDRNGVNQMPVIRDQHVIGMLSREDAITFLRTLQEFGTAATQQPKLRRS